MLCCSGVWSCGVRIAYFRCGCLMGMAVQSEFNCLVDAI
uniref:Uncharacterized protein n=1 Tax=Arundo donax TaxID=35708 RepID=A0A0A9DG72_ARUDO